MKFKATAAQIDSQEARDAKRRFNKRVGSGSHWKPPSPLTCKSYGCEDDRTHWLIFREYYRNGEDLKIGYCPAHVWNVQRIFSKLHREGVYVERITSGRS